MLPEQKSMPTRAMVGLCALLAILVFLIYGQTLGHDFVNYDDDWYVYANPRITEGLTLAGTAQAFTRKEGGLWTPLVTISHMLDCQLFGLKAGGHHLTNVLLHLASVILLVFALMQLTGALWRSAFVASLFAIHPLHVESVAWIAERKDVLSGVFFMLTLWAYGRYARRPESKGRYALVAIWFALGLMSKPMLVTLPFVLLLLDYWPLGRLFVTKRGPDGSAGAVSVNWRAVVEKIPLLALSFGVYAATIWVPKATGYFIIEQVPFWTRIGQGVVIVATYLRQMIWPHRLAVIYPHPEAGLPWLPAALLILALLSLLIFHWRRKHPYLWMGWLWNLGMLVPVSGIVQISRHAQADHYNYLPQIGLYIGLTWAVADWIGERRHSRLLLGSVAAAIVGVLSTTAFLQASYWRDSVTLWSRTIECTQDNGVAHNNLGLALTQQGRTDEAVAHCREAVRINPGYAQGHNTLGVSLFLQGQAENAITEFREAVRLNPAYVEAHNNLGNALFQQGKPEDAIAQYREALRLDPSYRIAEENLHIILLQQQEYERLKKSLEISPP